MKKVLLIILGSIIIILAVLLLIKKTVVHAPTIIPDQTPEKVTEGIINAVTFNCAANKTIGAIFFKDRVELSLSDKRNMLIPQGMSGSGARYANQDESFVFWNKGNTAFVEEKGVMTYTDCVN